MTYQATVYEQIAADILAGKALPYGKYQEELHRRGWDKRHFDAYVQDLRHIKNLMDAPDFNLRTAAASIRKQHPSQNKDVLRFSLTNAEKKIVLEAEDKGRIKTGEEIHYDGYSRIVKGADYMDLPPDTDAFVIFSGHPGTASPAVLSWMNDLKKSGQPKKLIFLGLYDNQGNTDFSDTGLKYYVASESEMYRRYFRALGVSEEIIRECLITPTDISTEENIALLAKVRNKYFPADRDVNFAMFGYPSYQKRIASEFAYGFQQLENAGKVGGTNFILPDTPVSSKESERYLSYDNLDGIAQDIIIGNCLAHPYRTNAGGRFDSRLGTYPEEFKPLLPISLVYSYPNVANELAGTDTKVATMLKLHRHLQHEVYGWEKPQLVDYTITYNILRTKQKIVKDGLASMQMLDIGSRLTKDNYIALAKKFYEEPQNKAEETTTLLYGKNAHPKYKQDITIFLNKQKTQPEK